MTTLSVNPTERLDRFRTALGVSTMLMVGLSWPLWVGASHIPPVPFLGDVNDSSWPVATSVLLLFTLAGSSFPRIPSPAWGIVTWDRFQSFFLGLNIGLIAWLILADQHRFQPWIYQFFLTSLAILAMDPSRALSHARLFIIALYFHSGLSKLDASFAQGLGGIFLATLVRPFGLDPGSWPEGARLAAILTMPFSELLVALGLTIRMTRPWAMAGAILLHLTLIGILGPWGLGHSSIVLTWNAALIIEVLILFYGSTSPDDQTPRSDGKLAPLVTLIFALAGVMPLTERLGIWDIWPSFALYAGHVARADVSIHVADLGRYPPELRRHLVGDADGPWHLVDLNAWSRAERGTPVYPQPRACLGLAEAMAAGRDRPRLVRVRMLGPAHRINGERQADTLVGLDAIQRWGESYWLNAHPSRPVPDE